MAVVNRGVGVLTPEVRYVVEQGVNRASAQQAATGITNQNDVAVRWPLGGSAHAPVTPDLRPTLRPDPLLKWQPARSLHRLARLPRAAENATDSPLFPCHHHQIRLETDPQASKSGGTSPGSSAAAGAHLYRISFPARPLHALAQFASHRHSAFVGFLLDVREFCDIPPRWPVHAQLPGDGRTYRRPRRLLTDS
jgi:hypothetical protein